MQVRKIWIDDKKLRVRMYVSELQTDLEYVYELETEHDVLALTDEFCQEIAKITERRVSSLKG